MTVGVVGAGQLGQMLALAGYPLGLEFLFLDPAGQPPAGRVAPVLQGEFTDPQQLAQLAARSQVVTFDWENVSVDALQALDTRICPPVRALAAAQDRVNEKRLFERLRIPTTRWCAVSSYTQLMRAVRLVGLPAVLKTRRFGYDGKGQALVRTADELDIAWQQLGNAPLLLEEWIPFDCEVSIIGARNRRGQVAIYPLNGNIHSQGILRLTRAPFGAASWQRTAARYLQSVLQHFRYTGILTIEFFVRRGKLIANEMAPRVHNSGHWTIEGAVTSQFENHLRGILDMPLGPATARGYSAMINLIGSMPPQRTLLAEPGLHIHDYGKAPRPGRKLGHCTFVAASARARDTRARQLLGKLAPGVSIP